MENEFKGTKGKWVIKQNHRDGQIIEISAQNENDSLDWMSLTLYNAKSVEAQQANAQLISKATELLERIKEQNIDLKILKNNLIKISESNKSVVGYSEIVQKWIDENENLIKEATTI